ncbi:MAG: glycine oxidase ThiO [Nitrospina sp.]|jgi:glycine oxidase ThiO|nr:glycine oxidase ThiO [Nitrospina sp.]MBT6716741.1 glycine oxidase ThiO [Nitrospina sp.]
MKNTGFDIVVIGSGVIGHSIAYRLKQENPQLRVAILGDPVNSLQASRAAAGMLAPFCECEVADPFFEFCRESLDKYSFFLEQLTSVSQMPVYFSQAGSLMPSFSFPETWNERKEFFKSESIPHELWDEKKVREKAPYLSKNCGEVMWVGEGQVNNRQLHDSLMAASRKLGVQILEENVSGFVREGSKVSAAVTGTSEVEGDQFVLASGSWSGQLAKVLDVELPLKPIKGQMCRLKLEDHFLDYTIHGMMTYIAPWKEGNGFVVGSTMEDKGFDSSVEDKVIENLIARAAEILPALKDALLIESWTGLRPAAEDLMPVMGRSGRYSNLYYSSGHYRNGILQTPNQADYMVSIIMGNRENEIPEFSPSRYNL